MKFFASGFLEKGTKSKILIIFRDKVNIENNT